MTTTFVERSGAGRRNVRLVWWMSYLAITGIGVVITGLAYQRSYQTYLGMSLAMLAMLILAWVLRPRIALYLTIMFATIDDIGTLYWYPFTKNLSSRETVAFISDALTVSPLEISLFVGFAVVMFRRHTLGLPVFPPSALMRPLQVFTGFVAMGFVVGLLGGGNLRIAVIEGRAMFYPLLVYTIVTSVCPEPKHLRRALWFIVAGVTLQAVLALEFYHDLPIAERANLETLTAHGAAIAMNLVFMVLLCFMMVRGVHHVTSFVFALAAIPIGWVYLISQRRAGIAALVVAVLMLFIVLRWRQPRTFWVAAPFTLLVVGAYLGAFWNSDSSAGFPAQAIKTIIAPDQASEKDQSSDLYRQVETFDLNYTIRQSPLTGLGFGREFLRPVELPEIEDFVLATYTPHNSVLWVWIKTGIGGFIAMFYLFGKSLMMGASRARRLPDGVDVIVSIVAATFVAMFALYSFVDISWDARNNTLLGLALAICAHPVLRRDLKPGFGRLGRTTDTDETDDHALDAGRPEPAIISASLSA